MLTNGIYDYVITATKEGLAQTKYGEVHTVDIDVMIDGQQRGNIRLWLNDANTNRAKAEAFLQSLGMMGTDGKNTLRDWSELIGKHGRATWEQKRLNRGGIVYNGSNFLPYEGPEATPTPTDAPKEETPAPVKADPQPQHLELEPLTADEQAKAAAVVEALLQDPEVQAALSKAETPPVETHTVTPSTSYDPSLYDESGLVPKRVKQNPDSLRISYDAIEAVLMSWLMLHCDRRNVAPTPCVVRKMMDHIIKFVDDYCKKQPTDFYF